MTSEERKERKKYFPKDGVERILKSLTKVHGDKLSISVRGVKAVLWEGRPDNWGILDMYEVITDEVKRDLIDSVKSTTQASAQ